MATIPAAAFAQAPDASSATAPDPNAAPPATMVAPPPAASPPPTASPFGLAKLWIGVGLDLFPTGNLSESAAGQSESDSLAFTYGFEVSADYMVTPLIFVGVSPRYLFGIKPSDSSANPDNISLSELDLRARVGVIKDIAPKLNIYGYGAIGYSNDSTPDKDGQSQPSASGLILGLAVGAKYDVAPKVRVFGELGYQFGLQSVSEDGESVDTHFDWLHVSIGAQFAAM